MSQYHKIGGRKIRIPNEVFRKPDPRKAVQEFLMEQAEADKSLKASLAKTKKEDEKAKKESSSKSKGSIKKADTKDESEQEDNS